MLEFVALIMFLLAAYIVFQKYIVRGFSGRWKGVGDALGQGRIYDPNKTTECATNVFFRQKPGTAAMWYDRTCFDNNCKPACLEVTKEKNACLACLAGCENNCAD